LFWSPETVVRETGGLPQYRRAGAPELLDRPRRWTFTAQKKLRVLAETRRLITADTRPVFARLFCPYSRRPDQPSVCYDLILNTGVELLGRHKHRNDAEGCEFVPHVH
jgi:hypothetical protein